MTDALVIIDMQHWMFRFPQRMAQVPSLVSNIARLTTAFEEAALPVFDVRTEHKADRSTWSRLMIKHDYPCLLEGTPDAAPVDSYTPLPTARPVIKRANSAFLRTDFENRLRDAGIARLILTGVFIDGCVGLTAADAAQRGFAVTFIDDAIGHAEAHLRAPLFDWLTDDYEIAAVTTDSFLERSGAT
ncbi:MAG: cysteine hydrolase [Hyphomicrobiales bacterium]|nr:cysteine hydrolase [Hyphomicrobiales bacterium]